MYIHTQKQEFPNDLLTEPFWDLYNKSKYHPCFRMKQTHTDTKSENRSISRAY